MDLTGAYITVWLAHIRNI